MPERFTETFIKGLQPPEKGARWEWDSELTGFLIRIFAPTRSHPEGARTFYLSYWLKGEKRYRIGSWPDWSVTAARAEAKAIRQRVDRGEDPATVRRELRERLLARAVRECLDAAVAKTETRAAFTKIVARLAHSLTKAGPN